MTYLGRARFGLYGPFAKNSIIKDAMSAANARLIANSSVPSSVSSLSTATVPVPSKSTASIASSLGGAVSVNLAMPFLPLLGAA